MRHRNSKSMMVVAGETSGDAHAAKVIRALLEKKKDLKVFGMGGPRMAEAGMEVREDLTRQALIGVWEVLRHYPAIRRRFKQCEKWLKEEKPDLLLLVDFPGFNLRLAQKAHALGVKVCYYIAPKTWAWNEKRVQVLREVVDRLLVIFPFEKGYFKKHGITAHYVGNPLLEEMDLSPVKREAVLEQNGISPSHFPLVCVMPGSRKGEIAKIWPLFLRASRLFAKACPDAAFIVPKPQGLAHKDYRGLKPSDTLYFVEAPAEAMRKVCDVAWVKSGTSTLEMALLKIPMVVAYKVAALTGFLAKRFIKVKYVSLVNLLAGKAVVAELLQERAKPRRLVAETLRLLEKGEYRTGQLYEFGQIKKSISNPPNASQNAAEEILKLLGYSIRKSDLKI
ncbi:MAG TPA: lipid-A-disaccharide synthase [bacterium]|nr:lipid-A-disaccharide synthase [bacterium]